MKRFLRIHSIKIRRTAFTIFCIMIAVLLGKGFYSVFKGNIESAAGSLGKYVAEKILHHIYIEESSVFAMAEDDGENDGILSSVINNLRTWDFLIKNDSDMLTVETISSSENIFHIYEDETTDEMLHSLEELALKENNEAVKTDADSLEEGMLIVDKIEGMVREPDTNDSFGEGEGDRNDRGTSAVSLSSLLNTEYSIEKMKNLNYLLANYYIVDASTKAAASLFQAETLLSKDMRIDKAADNGPQILIYHTHASETYIDSRQGAEEDTVVGPGEYLSELLREMGYNVYHDKTAYDKKDGVDNRNYAYSTARPQIEKFLAENPSVQVVIDLHRDSGAKRTAMIDGKPTAQIMFFNGLSRNLNGPIADLENPYIIDNLAFSLQTNLIGRSMYPGLMYKIYLKNYRYNMHLAARYLLIELGTQNNTVEEAYNAMGALAEVLDQVLSNR